MALTTVDLTPRFGAEIKSDARALLSGSVAAEIRSLLKQRTVLMIRDVGFDDAQQVAFAKTLGTINMGEVRQEGQDGIQKITFDEKENPLYAKYYVGTFYWHQDGTYDNQMPFSLMLTPRKLAPIGGDTEIADTYAAYEDLPESERKFLDGLKVIHTMEANYREAFPTPTAEQLEDWRSFEPKIYPLVCHHRSGRKSLVIGASAAQVVGMGANESEALLRRLNDWAAQRQFVYRHHWRMGDVLFWDNSGAMHRALPYDRQCGRRLHRLSLFDGEDTLAAA